MSNKINKVFYKLGRIWRKTRINSNKIQLSALYKCGDDRIGIHENKGKIIGLVRVKNEVHIIEQHLKAIALIADALIVLDDNSNDGTLQLVRSLADELNIVEIIIKTNDHYNEWKDRSKLLEVGRKKGGTHFIVLDADEMITSNFIKEDLLRKIIFSLAPGDVIELEMFNLWRSVIKYRADRSIWSGNSVPIVYCDDKKGVLEKKFIHFPRLPNGNGRIFSIKGGEFGVMHFQFVNWNNLLIKQAWYRCLEKINIQDKTVEEINTQYSTSKDERNIVFKDSLPIWFNGYSFFTSDVYDYSETWRKIQVEEWIVEYGKEYFEELDIWDVNWIQ